MNDKETMHVHLLAGNSQDESSCQETAAYEVHSPQDVVQASVTNPSTYISSLFWVMGKVEIPVALRDEQCQWYLNSSVKENLNEY